MSALVYKKLKEEEVEAVNSLNDVGVETWRNEFFSPYKPVSFVIQCTDTEKNEMVGCEGYVDYKLMLNGEMVQTHRSERTLVNPNYRGQGMFNKLIEGCDELAIASHSHMSWGATAALKAFERVGFDKFTGFRNYIFYPVLYSVGEKVGLMFKWSELLNPFKVWKIRKEGKLKDVRKLLSFLSMLKGAKKPKVIGNVTEVPIDYDEIKKMVANGGKDEYYLSPEESLFKWLGEKDKSYTQLGLSINGELIGHCIYKAEKEFGHIHVVDIFSKKPEYFPAILEYVAKKEKGNGMLSIFVPVNGANPTHALYINEVSALGVMNIQKAGNFVIKTLDRKEKITIDKLALTDLWLEL
ncbi:MAG: hypothetical protein KDC07_02775 [Chitinophagaceae bacterium]|nr:hypothetical protein [Chitinophagaceae bacterium]